MQADGEWPGCTARVGCRAARCGSVRGATFLLSTFSSGHRRATRQASPQPHAVSNTRGLHQHQHGQQCRGLRCPHAARDRHGRKRRPPWSWPDAMLPSLGRHPGPSNMERGALRRGVRGDGPGSLCAPHDGPGVGTGGRPRLIRWRRLGRRGARSRSLPRINGEPRRSRQQRQPQGTASLSGTGLR